MIDVNLQGQTAEFIICSKVTCTSEGYKNYIWRKLLELHLRPLLWVETPRIPSTIVPWFHISKATVNEHYQFGISWIQYHFVEIRALIESEHNHKQKEIIHTESHFLESKIYLGAVYLNGWIEDWPIHDTNRVQSICILHFQRHLPSGHNEHYFTFIGVVLSSNYVLLKKLQEIFPICLSAICAVFLTLSLDELTAFSPIKAALLSLSRMLMTQGIWVQLQFSHWNEWGSWENWVRKRWI